MDRGIRSLRLCGGWFTGVRPDTTGGSQRRQPHVLFLCRVSLQISDQSKQCIIEKKPFSRRRTVFSNADLMITPPRPLPQCPVCHKHQMLTKTVPRRFKATMIFAGLLATDLQNFGCGLQAGHTFRICGSCSTAISEAHKHAVLPEHGSKSPSLMRSGMKLSVPIHLEEDGAVPLLHAHGDPLVRAMHLYAHCHSTLMPVRP